MDSAQPHSFQFTPRAQQVLVLARKEVELRNQTYIGTEHLLLGLIRLGTGVSASVLQKVGLDAVTVGAAMDKLMPRVSEPVAPGPRPYTPRAKQALALANNEAAVLMHTYVGTEHILLGLLKQSDGVVIRVLQALAVDPLRLRAEILKELDPEGIRTRIGLAVDPQRTSEGISKELATAYSGMVEATDVVAIKFIQACIIMAIRRKDPLVAAADPRNPIHIKATEILAVAAKAAQDIYGETARAELKQMGIVSSETLGAVVFRLVEKGYLSKTAEDRIEDFKVKSALDEFLNG